MIKSSQAGRSMIEVIGVLAILSAVTMAITKMVNSVHDRYLISRITQQISDLRKGISNRYVASGTYENISAEEVIASNAGPSDMFDKENKRLIHAYDWDVLLSGTKDTYQITFEHLPHLACVELALMNWQFGGNSDLYSIKINQTEFNWPLNAAGGKVLPVEITDATTACIPPPPKDNPAAAVDQEDNDITWTFR